MLCFWINTCTWTFSMSENRTRNSSCVQIGSFFFTTLSFLIKNCVRYVFVEGVEVLGMCVNGSFAFGLTLVATWIFSRSKYRTHDSSCVQTSYLFYNFILLDLILINFLTDRKTLIKLCTKFPPDNLMQIVDCQSVAAAAQRGLFSRTRRFVCRARRLFATGYSWGSSRPIVQHLLGPGRVAPGDKQ